MHSHEHVVLASHRTPNHSDMLLPVEHRLIHVAGEVAPLRGNTGLGDATNELFGLPAVLDHLGDRDHQQAVFLAELDQVGNPRHRPVVVDDLAQHTGRETTRHARKVNRRLGVAGTLEHAALGVAQREDVTGTGKVAGTCRRITQRLDRDRPIRCGDPGGRAVAVVDGVHERRALRLGVVVDHQRNVERLEAVAREWRADHARGVTDEKGDGLGGGVLGRHDEVALVLAVLVVDDDDDLTATDRCDGVGDRGEDARGLSGC